MPGRQLKLPDYFDAGFKSLIQLTSDQVEALISALRAERPVYYSLTELIDAIASKVSVDRQKLSTIVRTLAGLYSVRVVIGLSIHDFAEAISQSVGEKGLKPPEPESWTRLKDNLEELLSLDGALTVASKAANVVTEQAKIFSHARVLSDLRPVFKEDPEVPPSALAIIHTLRIHYQESGELKSFFLALDDRDVRQLKDALERAQKKSATLRSFAQAANIPIVKTSEEPST